MTGAGGRSNDLTRLTAAALADMIAGGEVSSREVTQAHLDRIAAVDGDVHAFLHINTEGALETASAVDETERRSGDYRDPDVPPLAAP